MSMPIPSTELSQAIKWLQNEAPKIQSLIELKQKWYDQNVATFWVDWERDVFNLDTASNFGLMVWCIILGVPAERFGLYPVERGFAFGELRENFVAVDYQGPDKSLGGNFYGGGESTVTGLEEIRKILKLRYVALISRGNLAYINYMLKFIFNDGADWDDANGKYFYALDSSAIVSSDSSATSIKIQKSNWQGSNIEMVASPTARQNRYMWSYNVGADITEEFWQAGTVSLAYHAHWNGMIGYEIGAMLLDGYDPRSGALVYGNNHPMAFKNGSHTITLYYAAGTSGRLHIVHFGYGFIAGVRGQIGVLLEPNVNTSTVLISNIEDVLFDANNGVRRLRYNLSTVGDLGTVYTGVSPDSVNPGEYVIMYGIEVDEGVVPRDFVQTPNKVGFASRNTPATYMRDTDQLVEAAAGEPRYEWFRYNQNMDRVPVGNYQELMAENLTTQEVPTQPDFPNNPQFIAMNNYDYSPDMWMNMSYYVAQSSEPRCMQISIEGSSGGSGSVLTGNRVAMSMHFRKGKKNSLVAVRLSAESGSVNSFVEAVYDLDTGRVVRKSDSRSSASDDSIYLESAAMEYVGRGNWKVFVVAMIPPQHLNAFNKIRFRPVNKASDGVFSSGEVGDDVLFWPRGVMAEYGRYPSTLVFDNSSFAGRTSPASFMTAEGSITMVGNNVGRTNTYAFDAVSGSVAKVGPLFEREATNRIEMSQSFDEPFWTTTGIKDQAGETVREDGFPGTVLKPISSGHKVSLATEVDLDGAQCYMSCYFHQVATGGIKLSTYGFIKITSKTGLSSIFATIDVNTWEVSKLVTGHEFYNVELVTHFAVASATWPAARFTVAFKTTIAAGEKVIVEVGPTMWQYEQSPVTVDECCTVELPQFESAQYLDRIPSSYIENVGTANTRSRDVYSIIYMHRAAESTNTLADNLSQPDVWYQTVEPPRAAFYVAPRYGDILTWTGVWKGVDITTPRKFGVGTSVPASFPLNPPPTSAAPAPGPLKVEYRIGPSMGLSSQFVNFLNDETLGILPRGAGIKAIAKQE